MSEYACKDCAATGSLTGYDCKCCDGLGYHGGNVDCLSEDSDRAFVVGKNKAEFGGTRKRGVDYPCEDCGALKGYVLDDGWYRCAECGYPGK